MSYENHVTVVGHLTRDPEVRYTKSGRAFAMLGLAVNRRWMSNGEWQEETSFFDVTAWSDLAENVGDSLTKGARVTVSGRLEQQSYETDGGEKRSRVRIVADDIAASLRFATVEIKRNSKGDSRSSAPAQADDFEEPF